MKLLPAVLPDSTQSDAERHLHALLRQVDLSGYIAFHSLNVAEVRHKRWGEIDFLLVGPGGVIAIEVKGGGVASVHGIWEYRDRNGVVHRKRESPMSQARTALMGLRDWLAQSLTSSDLDSISFGCAVAFPDIEFTAQSPEWSEVEVGDRRRLRDVTSMASWLRRLVDHWQERTGRQQPLTSEFVERLVALMRPEFEFLPPLSLKVSRALSESDRLTAEQIGVLDCISENRRLLVRGGAGTGKTLLAAEAARREAVREPAVTVGVVVPHPVSALPFEGVLPDTVRVWVAPDLPHTPLDVLIVDEAQDLMTDEQVLALDQSVRGGLRDGRWRMFMDHNAQAGLRGAFSTDAYELVSAFGMAVDLNRNLRNSREIVQWVQDTVGADIGKAGGGRGPEVSVARLETDGAFADAASQECVKLSRAGMRPEDVVIITWSPVAEIADAIDGKPWPSIAALDASQCVARPGKVRVTSPEQFQGLEAACVVMGPVPYEESTSGLARCYVAETRARAHLVHVTTKEAAIRLMKARLHSRGRAQA